MYEVRIGLNGRPRRADQVEFRVAVGTSDPRRQVGMERLLVDPDLALRRIETLVDDFRLDDTRIVGPGRGGAARQ